MPRRQVLWGVGEGHLRGVVQQLLMAEGLPQPEVWAPIVAAAAQAVAAYLSPPLMYANGQHDPRQAVKVRQRMRGGERVREGGWSRKT